MTDLNKKRKKPVLLFIAVPLVIAGMMAIAHFTDEKVLELDIPAGGVKKLYTIDNSLVAISSGNQINVWDWNNLQTKPRKITFSAADVLLLSAGKVIWVPTANSNTIVISYSATNKELKRFDLGFGRKYHQMAVSRNGRFVAIAAGNKYEPNDIEIKMVYTDKDQLDAVLVIEAKGQVLICNGLAVSDDGRFIAAVGEKNDNGWIALLDINQKEISWQKQIEDSNLLTEVLFAPDSQTVYAAGIGRNIYRFGVSGKLIHKWQMKEYKIPPNQRQRVSCMDVSLDNSILAVGMTPLNIVMFWSIDKGDFLHDYPSGCNVLNGVILSPNRSAYAVTGATGTRPLKIRYQDKF